MKEALRYNEGKNRLDLVPPILQEEVGKVMTFGAQKYEPYNWAKGMKWSTCIASLKRHVSAFEKGEDFDPETGLYHLAHAGCNILFLLDYYKNHPELDDRQHSFLEQKKIGLDIDGVLADFIPHILKYAGLENHKVTHWNDPIIRKYFPEVKNNSDFWEGIPTLCSREDIHFEPHCYITARSISSEVTQAWLDKHHFPVAPLYCVGVGESKVEIAKHSGITHFVDDCYQNFVELSKAGIFTYLHSGPQNLKYKVGSRRIHSLKELV